MKAAYGAQPAHRQHGNSSHYSASVSRNLCVKSSTSAKMVMPPFLRLDSTGEVSSDDGPAVQVKGHRRTHGYHRQRLSTPVSNGFLGKLASQLAPQKLGVSSNHLTVSPKTMALGGISALDQLLQSRQTVEHPVARQAMRSPVKIKMAQASAQQQQPNWGILGFNYPWMPPGIFPCHLFDALQSGGHMWQLSSAGPFAHKVGMGALLNSCEHFAVQSFHQMHSAPPPGFKAVHEKHMKSHQSDASASVAHSKSGMSSSPSDIGHSMNSGCDKPTEVEVPVKCESPPSQSQGLVSNSFCATGGPEAGMAMCSCAQEASITHLQEKPMTVALSSRQNSQHLSVVSSPSHPSPAEEESIAKPASSPDIKQNDDASVNACSNIATGGCDSQEETDPSFINSAPDATPSKEEPHCWQFQGGGLSGWSHVDDESSEDDDSSDESSDEDDDSSDESEGELDLESQAEAINCFQGRELSEANLLCKKSKQTELEEERDSGQKRSPPRPDHAANRRWDKHHPDTVPSRRACKVQFTCGQDVDEVHEFERETLTVMEIQKLRDVSRQHNGKAAQILRMKSYKCESDEDESSQANRTSAAGSLCSSDGSVDVCDGVCDGPANYRSNVAGVSVQKKMAAGKILKEKLGGDDDSEEENDDYGVVFWAEGSVSTESEREDGDDSEDEGDDEEDVEEEDGFVVEFASE